MSSFMSSLRNSKKYCVVWLNWMWQVSWAIHAVNYPHNESHTLRRVCPCDTIPSSWFGRRRSWSWGSGTRSLFRNRRRTRLQSDTPLERGKLFKLPCWLTKALTVGEESLRNAVTVQLLGQLATRVVFGVGDSRVKRDPEHQQSKTFHYELNL